MNSDTLLQQLTVHYSQLLSPEHQAEFRRLVEQLKHTLATQGTLNSANSESEAYLQAMFESIQDYAVFTLDLNGNITTWNTGAQRVFGFSEAEAIGQSGAIIFTPEDRARGETEKELGQALQYGRAEDERWHMRRDGSRFFASGVMHKLVDDQAELRGFIKIARDVTERRQAEAAMREEQVFAKALSKIATLLSSTLKLDEVLEYILTTVQQVVPHDAAQLLLVEQEAIVQVRSRGYSPNELMTFEKHLTQHQVQAIPAFQQVFQTKRPLILANVPQDTRWQHELLTGLARAYIITPIIAGEQLLGFLNLANSEDRVFTSKHGEQLEAFAAQAAVAIRNAQLYLQAQEVAAINERQRLARDLHDAVTQNLFIATTLIDIIPQQWQKDPEEAQNSLALLARIIQGAFAEMRMLLLDLRPAKLLDTRLQVLLQQLVEAIQGHKNIAISLMITDDPKLPPEVHIAFYRIAQEALNNIAKHAHATEAVIQLYVKDGQVKLEIKDNGEGFDPEQTSSGMGIQMMRERAKAIGGHLQIINRQEGGAEIIVAWDTISHQK